METDIFERLLMEDNKILKALDNADNNHKKVLDIFARQVTLYKIGLINSMIQ